MVIKNYTFFYTFLHVYIIIGNQKMWDSKGNIKANYDIVNNRRYGLTGQKNCVSSNEIF